MNDFLDPKTICNWIPVSQFDRDKPLNMAWLWTGYDSELPTVPVTTTQLLKSVFDSLIMFYFNMVDYPE